MRRLKVLTDSARKRNARHSNKKRDATRIFLLESFDRWTRLLDVRGGNHADLALHLLEIHDMVCQCGSSTSNNSADHEVTLTASESGSVQQAMMSDSDFSPPPGNIISTPKSCIDPMNVSLMVHENSAIVSAGVSTPDRMSPEQPNWDEELMEMDCHHDERGPSTMLTAADCDVLDQSDTRATIGETVDIDDLDDDLLTMPLPETDQDPETDLPDTTETILALVETQKCVAYLDPILELVKNKAGSVPDSVAANHLSFLIASQPKFKRMFAENLQLATSILYSGNSLKKIALLFDFFNLGCISATTFYDVQRLYALPALERFWGSMQRDLLTTIIRRGGEVCVAGDGRNDSPGHCAQYCTYTLIDMETDAVLHLEIVDVREATSSPVMEKLGFQRALDFLLKCNIKVVEVVTDQNSSITKLMREHHVYSQITHQFDIWHVAKNLEKQLYKACKPKSLLRPWIKAVKNHFWWSAEDCSGDTLKMKETWVRVLCHVTNQHEWVGGECSHAPLNAVDEREKPWLSKSGPDMESLRGIVTEPRFLKAFPYFRNYRHTGAIESFNSHLLMYCPKRLSYQTTGYRARNLLAAIDHNHHLHRPDQLNQNGEISYRGTFNKNSKKWRPVKNKMEKNYKYKADLQVMAFKQKQVDNQPMKRKIDLAHDDPRNIYSTISKRPCPPIAQLVADHVSRMRSQLSDLPPQSSPV